LGFEEGLEDESVTTDEARIRRPSRGEEEEEEEVSFELEGRDEVGS